MRALLRPALLLSALASCAGLATAHAAPTSLIVNGDFEQTSMTSSTEMNTTNVTGWSTTGYNFIFFPGTADTTGSYTPQYNGYLQLWGPHNGGATGNALPATSPTGGNFVGADGAFEVGAISQNVTGLVTGTDYLLTFWWAAGQEAGFRGTTTENWSVSFGNQSYTTPTVTNPDQGFTPWQQASTLFRATSTSQVLSFLAAGTPSGQPPFSLLDGVSMVAAPEPATWAVMTAGLVAVSAFAARRRRPTRLA